jgi:hypothetical protein
MIGRTTRRWIECWRWEEVGSDITVDTLKEGRVGESIEMQRRTLLCGRRSAFIPMTPSWEIEWLEW